jgi:hypothetical protein
VDEVVGDLDPVEGTRQAVGVGDVAADDLASGRAQMPGAGGIADQGPDVPAPLEQ